MTEKNTAAYMLRITAALCVLCMAAVPVSGQDISVRAYINQSVVVVNQVADLAIEVSSTAMNQNAQPELPDFEDWFSFAGSRGSSQSVSIVNGRVSASVTYTYGILPLKTGTATIPRIRVVLAGKEYFTDPVTVEIRDVGAAPPAQRQAQPRLQIPQNPVQQQEPVDIHLVTEVDKRTVYQNEGLTVAYKVYFGPGVTVREYTPLNTPNTAGFWTEEYSMESSPRAVPETYNGKQYNAAVLQRVELFPTNSGEFELDPKQIKFVVRLPRRSRSLFDRFDSFFDNPFSGSLKEVTVSSNRLNITVKPLPTERRPPGFSGFVGDFTIKAEADNDQIKVNDTITLVVTISGTGNIKLIGEPILEISDTFELYDPNISENIDRSGSDITGEKTFEYVLIPRQPGSYTIGSIPFSYFDPVDGSFKTVRTSPIAITAEPGEIVAGRTPRNLTREEIRLVGQDIRFIQESVARWYQTDSREFFSWIVLTMLFSPVVLYMTALTYCRHLHRLNKDTGYKRSRQANSVATKRLKKARTFLQKDDSQQFYPEIAQALQEYIADKLNVAAAGIVTGELEKQLRNKNIDEDLISNYISCLKICDYFRFSKSDDTFKEMEKLYNDSRKSILDMEERLKKAV